jgi:hypothetical protein
LSDRNIQTHVRKTKGNKFEAFNVWDFKEIINEMCCVFTLKMWGGGYMTKLLAISLESLCAVMLVQLTMELITVLV